MTEFNDDFQKRYFDLLSCWFFNSIVENELYVPNHLAPRVDEFVDVGWMSYIVEKTDHHVMRVTPVGITVYVDLHTYHNL